MKATQRKVRADEIMRSESRIRVSVVESAEQLTRKKLSRTVKKCHKCKKRRITIRKFCKSKFSKSVHGLDEYSSCESDGEKLLRRSSKQKTEIKENACFSSFKLQDIITKNPVLSFYDVSKPVTVSCDASQCGLGAMLIQDNKPVAYASRSLTDAESRYANIERELLGVLFGLERFNDYTYGKHINVESDHKPLEMIVRKSLIKRMLLRLQKYDFSLKYIPGKDLIVPDMLSRAPIKINTNNEVENDIECFVNMVIRNTSMSDRNLEQITEETSKDDTLQTLTRLIIDGWPDEKNEVPKEVFEYWNFRDELSNVNGIILKGEKIIIPTV
ncbi:unnamed protein product [Mytilus coruscus]|uniref:Reverse transcriptase RNase H-like domain-containing protein n=1 Tax=Mytilus coruscus TaxID=42192 RepID=A0A6J8ASJ6_MYTCO|nr:unnamed protein product [Mytilus coruscus]